MSFCRLNFPEFEAVTDLLLTCKTLG